MEGGVPGGRSHAAAFAAALAAAALATGGCCSIARVLCDIEPRENPPRGDRDTPQRAVAFLVDAFRNHGIRDVFESLDADFVEENGRFSLAEFSAAYEKYEEDFRADAEHLAAAARSSAPGTGGSVVVRLLDAAADMEISIAFVDRPTMRVATSDEWLPPLEDAVDMSRLVHLEGGVLRVDPVDLTRIAGVDRKTLEGIGAKDVERIEIHHDWRVRAVGGARNVRFLDRIKELVGR